MFNLSQSQSQRKIKKKINTACLKGLFSITMKQMVKIHFHRTSLRWRRIMVESADSSKTYQEFR